MVLWFVLWLGGSCVGCPGVVLACRPGGLVVLEVVFCVVGCVCVLFRVGVVGCVCVVVGVCVWLCVLVFSWLLGLGPWLCVFCLASCFTSVGVCMESLACMH